MHGRTPTAERVVNDSIRSSWAIRPECLDAQGLLGQRFDSDLVIVGLIFVSTVSFGATTPDASYRWALTVVFHRIPLHVIRARSYWESAHAMSRFAGDEPTRIHHLDRDPEFLIELPQDVQILNICASHGNTGGGG